MGDPGLGESKPLAAREAPACQVCGEPLHGRAVVECCQCGTPHHLSCWRFNKRCSIYGCGCRSCRQPAVEVPGRPKGSFEIQINQLYRSYSPLDGIVLGSLAAIAGLLFATGAAPQLLAPLGLSIVFAFILLLAAMRERLFVDVDRGAIDRSLLMMGRTLWRTPAWLDFRRIVELHVHRWQPSPARRVEMLQLHALLDDGTRRKILTDLPTYSGGKNDLPRVAEQIAELADCPVRRFEGEQPPSRAELEEAMVAWRASRTASAGAALPPDQSEAGPASLPATTAPSADAEPPPSEREASRPREAERG